MASERYDVRVPELCKNTENMQGATQWGYTEQMSVMKVYGPTLVAL